jgi:hypothetical protein
MRPAVAKRRDISRAESTGDTRDMTTNTTTKAKRREYCVNEKRKNGNWEKSRYSGKHRPVRKREGDD